MLGDTDESWAASGRERFVALLEAAGQPVGISPHAPYTLDTGVLGDVTRLAHDLGLRLHIHLAEGEHEREYTVSGTGPLARLVRGLEFDFAVLREGGTGLGPTSLLGELGMLGPGCHIAHGVYLDADDRALLRARGTAVALCPRSNQTLGLEDPDVAALLTEGNLVAVGTDSLSSSPSLDVLADVAVLRDLAVRQGYLAADLDRRLVEAATLGGARAMGIEGGLAPGGSADFAVFDVPVGAEPYRTLIEQGPGRCFATIIGGEMIWNSQTQIATDFYVIICDFSPRYFLILQARRHGIPDHSLQALRVAQPSDRGARRPLGVRHRLRRRGLLRAAPGRHPVRAGVGAGTALAIEVQHERKFSSIQLSGTTERAGALAEVRGRTDKAVGEFIRHTTSSETRSVLSPALGAAVAEVTAQVEKLRTIRGDVDGHTVNRLQAVQAFSAITDAVYRLQDQVVTVSEIGLYQQAVGLQRISHAQDLLSREDALVSGATLAGGLTHAEYEAMEVLAPNRRLLLSEGVAALDDELSGPFRTLIVSPGYRGLVALEIEIVEESKLPYDRKAWQPIADAFSTTTDKFLTSRGALLNERTDATAGGIIAQIVIAGGLGLAAILGAVILSAKLGRRLAEELGHLRMTALELAEVRLPQVVERLRRGESVDVKVDAPPIPTTGTTLEITDVARAFSTVQSTAVEAAVGEARLRHGFNRVFRNLARRNQSLVHRQLTQLDTMQRKTSEPEVLRTCSGWTTSPPACGAHAEGLIILSGARPGRAWRKPVPLLDMVRAARRRGRGLHAGQRAAHAGRQARRDRRRRRHPPAGRAPGERHGLLSAAPPW